MKTCACCNGEMNSWEGVDVSVSGKTEAEFLPGRSQNFALCTTCARLMAVKLREAALERVTEKSKGA